MCVIIFLRSPYTFSWLHKDLIKVIHHVSFENYTKFRKAFLQTKFLIVKWEVKETRKEDFFLETIQLIFWIIATASSFSKDCQLYRATLKMGSLVNRLYAWCFGCLFAQWILTLMCLFLATVIWKWCTFSWFIFSKLVNYFWFRVLFLNFSLLPFV